MAKRIFELDQNDVQNMNASLLFETIKRSEGRTVMAEVCCGHQPLIDAVSNAEAAAAFGADMITLNLFDVQKPFIWGLFSEEFSWGASEKQSSWLANKLESVIHMMDKSQNQDVIQKLKKITGRLIGVNLEPVPQNSNYASGFCANFQNYEQCLALGFDYVVLTGNPKTGVTIDSIAAAAKELKSVAGDKIFIISGKMHGAGGDNVYTLTELDKLIEAGTHVVMTGAPATLPGYTIDFVYKQIEHIHKGGVLAKTAIGTSQEGATTDTIRDITLWSKMAGTDIMHIGDAAYSGMALPENIMAVSVALRGIRHTYRRMAFRK